MTSRIRGPLALLLRAILFAQLFLFLALIVIIIELRLTSQVVGNDFDMLFVTVVLATEMEPSIILSTVAGLLCGLLWTQATPD